MGELGNAAPNVAATSQMSASAFSASETTASLEDAHDFETITLQHIQISPNNAFSSPQSIKIHQIDQISSKKCTKVFDAQKRTRRAPIVGRSNLIIAINLSIEEAEEKSVTHYVQRVVMN
jgi:hypothetical protein